MALLNPEKFVKVCMKNFPGAWFIGVFVWLRLHQAHSRCFTMSLKWWVSFHYNWVCNGVNYRKLRYSKYDRKQIIVVLNSWTWFSLLYINRTNRKGNAHSWFIPLYVAYGSVKKQRITWLLSQWNKIFIHSGFWPTNDSIRLDKFVASVLCWCCSYSLQIL